MSEVALFGNTQMPAEYKALLAQIDPVTSLAGGDFGSSRRISIKGGVFREIINGKEVGQFDGRTLNVVILNASPVTRTFYEGTYDDANPTPPACWSADSSTGVPASDVPDETRQASRCADCPQNIKGSGQGDSRACRFQQRIAVILEEDIGKEMIYQLQIPATSLFGDAVNGQMPLQSYARFLQGHNTPCISVISTMKFDTSVATPKLTFTASRPLAIEELKSVIGLQKHADTMKAIEFTVAKMDGVQKVAVQAAKPAPATQVAQPQAAATPAPAAQAAPATRRSRAPAAQAAAPATPAQAASPEPTVRSSRRAAPAAASTASVATASANPDLASIVSQWDDPIE